MVKLWLEGGWARPGTIQERSKNVATTYATDDAL